MNNSTPGRTRWRRFAALAVPGFVATGIGLALIAQGALAVSFTVANSPFTLTADSIAGTGFKQFGAIDTSADKASHAVAPAIFADATITKMCQSITNGPFLLRLDASKAVAKGLVVDIASLNADADFTNFSIGQDAGSMTGNAALSGTLGQSASAATLSNVRQTAYATTAGSFILSGLSLNVSLGNPSGGC